MKLHFAKALSCIFTLCVGVFAQNLWAHDAYKPLATLKSCTPTPLDRSVQYPGRNHFITSNKLARPAGKALYANGQLLLLEFDVVDEHCKPVTDARIDLWQTDPFGKYVHANRAQRATPDPIFAGTGTVYSNNLGKTRVETLYPGGYGEGRNKRAPHIHMRVDHRHYPALATTFYFEGDIRNEEDVYLKRLSPSTQDKVMIRLAPMNGDINTGLVGHIRIVLDGKSRWKTY